MNRGKFAPITSALLARKGEAKPWQAPGYEPRALTFGPEHRSDIGLRADGEGKSPPEPANPPPNVAVSRIATSTNPEAPAERTKRISLVLSLAEFEKLGIAAVKKGVSRQQVMRNAIEFYIAQSLNLRCECLSDNSCQCDCPAGAHSN